MSWVWVDHRVKRSKRGGGAGVKLLYRTSIQFDDSLIFPTSLWR